MIKRESTTFKQLKYLWLYQEEIADVKILLIMLTYTKLAFKKPAGEFPARQIQTGSRIADFFLYRIFHSSGIWKYFWKCPTLESYYLLFHRSWSTLSVKKEVTKVLPNFRFATEIFYLSSIFINFLFYPF